MNLPFYSTLIAALLLLGVPIWDHFEMRALKRAKSLHVKVSFYARFVAVLWLLAIAAWATGGSEILWPPYQVQWPVAVRILVLVAAVAPLLLQVFQAVRSARNAKIQEKMEKAYRRLAFMLPSTPQQRRWFAAVSVT